MKKDYVNPRLGLFKMRDLNQYEIWHTVQTPGQQPPDVFGILLAIAPRAELEAMKKILESS